MICRKATFTINVSAVTLPNANSPSARAQKCQFCAREGPHTGVHTLRTFAADSSCDCFATNR